MTNLDSGGHLAPFLALNGDLEPDGLRRRVRECAAAGFDAVILHPRPGLRTPYLSKAWFEAIGCCVRAAREEGIKVWLYDEYPYPSGAAGGRVIRRNPDLMEKHLLIRSYPLAGGGRVSQPLGSDPVLEAFLVPEDAGDSEPEARAQVVTDSIGMRNTTWISREWDSRFYYPPAYSLRYECPRAMEYLPEQVFEAELPEGGWKLITFTVASGSDFLEPFGNYVDLSNPMAAEVFLEETHERYRRYFGDVFGTEILGVFTDEPKYRNALPWSAGIAAWPDYQRDPRALLALLPESGAGELRRRFREWSAGLFTGNWVRPIRDWCRRARLGLIGHISPEEDWWLEVRLVGSILRNLREFSVPGCDLIIPAVGDRAHPVLNLTPALAVSAAAQTGASHALCEAFGASGYRLDLQTLKRVGDWLMVSGINFIVPHGCFYSLEGPRRFDAPPTFLPPGTLHPFLGEWSAWLHATMEALGPGPARAADVAIVRPMTHLCSLSEMRRPEAERLFGQAVEIAERLLERGLVFHLVDDADLEDAPVRDGGIAIGCAKYHRLIGWPELLSPAVARRLEGVPFLTPEEALRLPGPLECPDGDVRAVRGAAGRWFCVNLSPAPREFRIEGRRVCLEGYESRWAETPGWPREPLYRRALGPRWQMRPGDENTFRLMEWTCNGVSRPVGPCYEMLVSGSAAAPTVYGPVPLRARLPEPRRLVFEASLNWQGRPAPVALNLEEGTVEGRWQAWFNDTPLEQWQPCAAAFGGLRHDLGGALREGINRLRVEVLAEDARHGLWLEPVVRGGFVVDGSGCLRAGPDALAGGEWSGAGYPHFSGAMDFEREFLWEPAPEGGEAWLVFATPPAGMVEIFVNEVALGKLLWSPWRRRIAEALRPGMNRLRLRVTNTLQNYLRAQPHPSGPLAGAEIQVIPA